MPRKPAKRKKNVKVNEGNRSLVSSMGSEDDSDVILVTQSEPGVDEEIKEDAKAALHQALNEEELHVAGLSTR